ncbi:hypothetical protein ONZ51_g13478 [Trametes cubensis]|uniref:Heterokaryon incompatibility domain-containing protein n=1 Tax=Trametes cubensis TaxID=1111947 RepID=A0AAD7TF94_9APHY|nr:hypothetical protein ONZ51_g13478 [Trametes cubensis]
MASERSLYAMQTPSKAHIAITHPGALTDPRSTSREDISGHSSDSARPAPTRLIDCRNPNRPRIILTNGRPYVYVALSYVWGKDRPHRTTKKNLSTYMKYINPTAFSRTIRDAVFVTNKLGIGFLWTDSLCIIQDSPEDKHRELLSMRDVYRHAYLTIDAASAAKASEGFLQDRPPLDPDLVFPFICPKGAASQLPERGSLYLYYYAHSDIKTGNRGNFRTGERAWCLQETMLSTRCLVFTDSTVQVRCQTTTQNVDGVDHDPRRDVPRLPDAIFHHARPMTQYSAGRISIRETWHRVVKDYSSRRLSYRSDKLVACAGLVEMFAPVLGSVYVAGCWSDDFLLHDLLWYVSDRASTRPTEYLAPSWSWASLEQADLGPFPDLSARTRAMVAVVRCTTTAQDGAFPHGPVIGGKLILRAHLCRCRLKRGREGQKSEVLLGTESTQGMYDRNGQVGVKYYRIEEIVDTLSVQVISYFDRDDETINKDLWAVPLQLVLNHNDDGDEFKGILLVSCCSHDVSKRLKEGNQTQKTFRRVGYFESRSAYDLQELGWDGEWSLETATELVIV